MPKLWSLLLAALLAAAAGCSEAPREAAAADEAVSGDISISRDLMQRSLQRCEGDSARIYAAVDNMISRQLILLEAESMGLDTTTAMQRYRHDREREQLQSAWMSEMLGRVELPPDTVQSFYDRMGTMVVYRAMNVADSALCDSLRELVVSGADMGELVTEHTSIQFDAPTGGLVGPTDMQMTYFLDRELLEGLGQGEVSPMDTFPSGWRFLRVESLYVYDLPPLPELEQQIGARILGRLQEERKRELEDSLRVGSGLAVTPGVPELVAEHATDDTGEYEPYTEEELSMDAYAWEGGSRSLYSLVENIRSLPPMMPRSPTDPGWVESYCMILGLYDVMAMEAREMGMDTLPSVMSVAHRSVENELLDTYYDSVIAPQIEVTEEAMLEVFEENRDMLLVPEERVFSAIGALTPEQVEVLDEALESGADPFTMTDTLSPIPELASQDDPILTRPLTADDVPSPWDSLLFASEVGDLVPCSLSRGRVILFRTEEVSEEHQASFEEAEDELSDLVYAREEEEVISALVERLRAEYHYEVDWDYVDSFLAADTTITEP